MLKKLSLLFACFGIIATAAVAQEPVKRTKDPVRVEPSVKPAPETAKPAPATAKPVPATSATSVTVNPQPVKRPMKKMIVKPKSEAKRVSATDQVK
jgi:hypothetical protein